MLYVFFSYFNLLFRNLYFLLEIMGEGGGGGGGRTKASIHSWPFQ